MRIWRIGKKLCAEAGACVIERVKRRAEKRTWSRRRQTAGKPPCALVGEVLEAPYCFVLSTGRCGTGFLSELLQTSPKLLVEHNPEPELGMVSSLVHTEGTSKECLRLAMLAARFDVYFQEAFERGRIYVETNNRITFFAPALAEVLPNAKFIHLVRHPAEFVRSGIRRGYYDGTTIQHQRLRGKGVRAWDLMTRIEKIGWEWNEINRACENVKETVKEGRILTIKSEDLFRRPGIVQEVWQFIGVESPYEGWMGKRKLNRIYGRPVNVQRSGKYPRYADWPDEDKERLRNVATLAKEYNFDMQ